MEIFSFITAKAKKRFEDKIRIIDIKPAKVEITRTSYSNDCIRLVNTKTGEVRDIKMNRTGKHPIINLYNNVVNNIKDMLKE